MYSYITIYVNMYAHKYNQNNGNISRHVKLTDQLLLN